MHPMMSGAFALWAPKATAVVAQHGEPCIRLRLVVDRGAEDSGSTCDDLSVTALFGREDYARLMDVLARAGLAAGWIETVGAATRPEERRS